MRRRIMAAAVTALLLGSGAALAESKICRVADPTGTPLNIRLQPNGEIVDTVRNGAEIQVFTGESVRDAKGRLWYYVALPTSSAPDGYVLAAYVRCR